MSNRSPIFERFGIISRGNSFLKLQNLPELKNNFNLKVVKSVFDNFIVHESEVTSITNSQLDGLYFHTIYNSDGPFNLIDYLMEFRTDKILNWVETKLSYTAEEIEEECKEKVVGSKCDQIEGKYLEKWLNRQPKGKPIDSDLLALRTMETLILLSIINFQFSSSDSKDFKVFEEKLSDWSEAVGLIRSLSDDNRFNLAIETSMDVDFDPSADTSQLSTIFSVKQSDFEIYLLEKFKGFKNIKEIVEIVAERCGIPLDSDFEDEKQKQIPQKLPSKESSKHWRRVKPVTLPVKRVTSSVVNRPSSLSVTELKSNRFLSTSSTSSRQVDLALKPSFEPSTSNSHRRRHSEASASQIIQQTTPTKSRRSQHPSSISNTTLPDAFVILETPPRALAKQIPENDLTCSVRRLFPQQPMEE